MAEQNKKNAKQLAKENFEFQRERLKNEGYEEHEALISVLKANIFSVLLAFPLITFLLVIYVLVWGQLDMSSVRIILVLLVWLVSMAIHELLHGLGWSFSCKDGFKSVRFGVIWSKLTPYCSCKEPLGFKQYLLGAILPLVILALIPSIIAICVGNEYVLCFGILSFLASGGDILICLNMRKYRNSLFLDHPTACGFYAFRKTA